jgi:hypothetical protein
MIRVLRFILLFPPVFAIALWLMLPALLRDRVPVWHWPAATLYALFTHGRR